MRFEPSTAAGQDRELGTDKESIRRDEPDREQ